MVKINVYLLKNSVSGNFHYSIKDSKIITLKNSVFDDDVYLKGEYKIKSHILGLKKEPKEVKRATSENELYFRNEPPYLPDWAKFWNITDTVRQQTADSVVLLNIGKRKIAVCHGHSQHLINPFVVESYFGLRTAVNMLDPKKINSTDIFTPSEASLKKRIKSDIGSKFEDFDINTLNTLLKNISGKVKEEYKEYVKYLDAADNLKFNFSGNPTQLESILSKLLQIYNLDSYKNTVFKYLDNFVPIKDRGKIELLDKALIKAINNRNTSLMICTPIDMNYSGLIHFSIEGLGIKKRLYYEFDIAKIFFAILDEKCKTISSLDDLKKLKLSLVDQNNKIIARYPLYKCLYFEKTEGNTWHFLEYGIWYQVEKDFSDSIEKEISNLLKYPISFDIKYNKYNLYTKYSSKRTKTDKYENWFNQELTNHLTSHGDSIVLDTNNIQMDGYNKIEVCDVFFRDTENNKYLFHNKYSYGSSSLSHLFSQGNVAAELLTNRVFRSKVNDKIKNENLKFPMGDDFNTKEYTIVYGIIMRPNKDGLFNIPLFSKINLKIFVDSLRSKSYKCKLCFFEEEML